MKEKTSKQKKKDKREIAERIRIGVGVLTPEEIQQWKRHK